MSDVRYLILFHATNPEHRPGSHTYRPDLRKLPTHSSPEPDIEQD